MTGDDLWRDDELSDEALDRVVGPGGKALSFSRSFNDSADCRGGRSA